MEYRVGSEGWTEAAKAGLPLFCDVSARWDPEANVFVAESEDFLPAFACVAESPTWEGLGKELDAVFFGCPRIRFGIPGISSPPHASHPGRVKKNVGLSRILSP